MCIRDRTSKVPIIMLTAKGDEEDELTGFELGVDEYISKPFSPKILVARVGAILRRSGKAPEEGKLLSIGGIVIDQNAHTVTVDGRQIELSFKEFELLTYFMENEGIALSREKILNHVWKDVYKRQEHQRKGIGQCVQVNGHMHNHWKQYTLPLDNIEKVDFSKEYKEGLPGFYRFTVDIDETADTFLDFEGWGKGCVFVNGFNIGRFWEIGPQKRLYLPAPLLKKGENEIIVFETEGKTRDTIVLKDEPDIG